MSVMTTNKPLSDEEMLHFQAWRATALQVMPYFASMLFSFRPIATTQVDTFAIDPGHRVYINFENCIEKGAAFCAEGLLHEAGHLLGEHSRMAEIAGVQDHERKAWNVAGDFAINDDLRDAGCDLLTAHGVFASMISEPDYETPLYYMDKLRARQNAKNKQQQQQQQQQQQAKGSPSDPSDGSGQGDAAGPADKGPLKGCGSGAGGEKGGFELDLDDSFDGKSEGATPVERELVRIRVAAEVKQHQDKYGRGSVPGGIVSTITEILAPSKTPWDRVLASFMRMCVNRKAGYVDESYTRRNRRRMNEVMRDSHGSVRGRVIAPGYVKPAPTVHFYRDTSGSVRDHELSMATNEVLGISRRLGISHKDLVVTDIDATVRHSKEFKGLSSVAAVHGRGGTDMRKAIEHACSLKVKPTCIVIATDGETPWPAHRPSVPVIVLLANARKRYVDLVPDWALTVEIGDAA